MKCTAPVAAGVLLAALFQVTMSITVEDAFPAVKGNLTKVMWAHAVNSQQELTAALNSSVHMIEADVSLGKDSTSPSNTTIPIMAHPPNNVSNLSLDKFLAQVLKNGTKGFKLDFKSIDAFTEGLIILKKLTNVTVPMWLNADILAGPVNPTTSPVNATEFLKGAKQLPQALLSIGWTTQLETNGKQQQQQQQQNGTGAKYTVDQIKSMLDLVKNQVSANQSVTYPVRAIYAANATSELQALLTNSSINKPTLTIWSHENDSVNVTKLNELIKAIGVGKLYVDVPESLRAKLDLNAAGFGAQSSVALLLGSLLAGLHAARLL